MSTIDLSKIKLHYKNNIGAGKEIHASLGQKFNCVEFAMRDDVPQPITWTFPDNDPPRYLCSGRWIQFEPKEWANLMEAIFQELVKLWNEKYGHDKEESDG